MCKDLFTLSLIKQLARLKYVAILDNRDNGIFDIARYDMCNIKVMLKLP